MTQRDKWKGRPVVQKYFAFRDFARLVAGKLPDPESIVEFNWTAYFDFPESYTKVKRAELAGELHRVKPDRDNIDKALLDSLFPKDAAIASGKIKKVWGSPARIEVEILYEVEK